MSSAVDAVQARRAARKAARKAEFETQRALDLEALDALEIEHGDSRVSALNIPWEPGSPTLVAVRLPTVAEIKRYRARISPPGKAKPDPVKGAEELGRSCGVYPEGEMLDLIAEKLPVVLGQMGVSAANLAAATEEEEGKD